MRTSMSWPDLKRFVNFVPKRQFPELLEPLSEDLFMFSEQVFYFVVPHDRRCAVTADAPFLTCVIWAQSAGAARRAMNSAIEDDREMNGSWPPQELLPKDGVLTYGDILRAVKSECPESVMETASYRVASDGAFIHKSISARLHDGRYEYYFRSPKIFDEERPYAVSFKGQ